jgi:hypothetical protein
LIFLENKNVKSFGGVGRLSPTLLAQSPGYICEYINLPALSDKIQMK